LQSEQVLVVPRRFLFRDGEELQGFFPGENRVLLEKIATGGFYEPRFKVEDDPELKQIITYLVIRFRGFVFIYQRLKASMEKRLVSKYSIGLGGHINPCPVRSFESLILNNLHRELKEEVYLEQPYSCEFLGVVNDETTMVGRHHLGLVYLISASSPQIRVREKEKISGRLIPVSELESYREELESWSLLLVPKIIRVGFHQA